MTCTGPCRLLSLVLVVVLVATLVAPVRAEAMEPTTIITLASLGIGVLAVIGFLIVANIEGDKPRTEGARTVLPSGEQPREEAALWLACPSGKCAPIVLPSTASSVASPDAPPMATAPAVANGAGSVMERQGP